MTAVINENTRKKYLALIHIQKARAALTDEEYASFLLATAGVESASKIKTPEGFRRVISGLNKILIAKGLEPLERRRSKNDAFLNAIKTRANAVLGSRAEKRLSGFLNKMGKANLEDCNPHELRRVMGFITNIERKG